MIRSLMSLLPVYSFYLLLAFGIIISAKPQLNLSTGESLQCKATSPHTTDCPDVSFYSFQSLLSIAQILENIRGGGREDYDDLEESDDEYDSGEDDFDEDISAEKEYGDKKSRLTHSARDQYRSQRRPSYDPKYNRRGKNSSSSSLSSATNAASAASKLVGKSLSATGSLAFNAFVKTPGKLAFHAIRPKHVDLIETFGLWRLDQEVIERSNRREGDLRTITSVATIEFSRPPPPPRGGRGRPRRVYDPPRPPLVVVRHNKGGSKDGEDGGDEESLYRAPYTFVRKNKYLKGTSLSSFQTSFVAPAFLVGESHTRLYGYKGTWQRKLADKSIIKLKGKIYQVHKQKFGKKRGEYVFGPAVGRFVMRRRISITDEDNDEHDGSDFDEDDVDYKDDDESEYYDDLEEYSDVEDYK
mmetsp:Transcript_25323/g.59273  ORF Transcript_25323/g.59273 Transcript_25323/m.59273 type:complete len:413 (-) Transcript_25323:168-1406(-)